MLPKGWLLWIAVAALVVAPAAAEACSVCFSGEEETRVAFLLTTGLMTFLPLVMIGGVIWWVRRRFLRLQGRR